MPHKCVLSPSAESSENEHLSLPEIYDLSLEDVLLLAISRHETFTGQNVETSLSGLPEIIDQGLKICCYRFVQEGLTNSFKHAAGASQIVSADMADNVITLTVSDDGAGEVRIAQENDRISGGIGLLGLRHRLDVFGGQLDLKRVAFNGVHPIESNSQHSQSRFVLGCSQSESDWLQPALNGCWVRGRRPC